MNTLGKFFILGMLLVSASTMEAGKSADLLIGSDKKYAAAPAALKGDSGYSNQEEDDNSAMS